jgi:hypothetical protein
MIVATSEATFRSSNNEKGEETNRAGGGNGISHSPTYEERRADEDPEMLDASPAQIRCTESRTMQRTSSSSLEERLDDKTRWGHFDPRTEWPEWQEVVCGEDIDAVLVARRARNRQLGKW